MSDNDCTKERSTKRMKKQGKKIIGIMLALVLALTCVPVTNAKATTIAEMATQTIKLGEFDSITFTRNVPIVLKIQLKTPGKFEIHFTPYDARDMDVELYDEQNNLVGEPCYGYYWSYIKVRSFNYYNDLAVGTYYLRIVPHESGTYAFSARMIPSENAGIQICPNIKTGKTLQLTPAFISCKDKKVTWKSSNNKVATVSASGKVKALKKGSTTIKVYNQSGIVTKLKIKVV